MSEILDAADVDVVDFFSLDVEGAELVVLQSIDWSRTRIRVLISESASPGGNYASGGGGCVRAVLTTRMGPDLPQSLALL